MLGRVGAQDFQGVTVAARGVDEQSLALGGEHQVGDAAGTRTPGHVPHKTRGSGRDAGNRDADQRKRRAPCRNGQRTDRRAHLGGGLRRKRLVGDQGRRRGRLLLKNGQDFVVPVRSFAHYAGSPGSTKRA